MAKEDLNNLTAQQIKFCEEYAKDSNASRAAIAAGYTEKNARQMGYQLLKKKYVMKYLEELSHKVIEKSGVDVAWWMRTQKKVIDRCMQTESVEVKIKGKRKKMLCEFNAAGANSGLNNMAKCLHIYTDDTAPVEAGITINISVPEMKK